MGGSSEKEGVPGWSRGWAPAAAGAWTRLFWGGGSNSAFLVVTLINLELLVNIEKQPAPRRAGMTLGLQGPD